MKRLFAASAGIALVLSLAACGGGEDAKASEAISKEFQSGSATGGAALSAKEADCVGDGMVSEIGVDKLQESGLITEDLTADQSSGTPKLAKADAEKAVSVLGDCTDLYDLVLGEAGAALDAPTIKCLRGAVTEADLEALLAPSFAGETPAPSDEFTKATTECLTPS